MRGPCAIRMSCAPWSCWGKRSSQPCTRCSCPSTTSRHSSAGGPAEGESPSPARRPLVRETPMAFIASNGLTEAGTSKTVQAGGMTIHYHDIGTGEPVLFLHSYGPGTTAWITFYKTIGVLSQHFRCILMDMPNFSKTGPIVYHERVHAVQARTAVALMDALGIQRAHYAGNSQGGQSSLVAAISYPSRTNKFVMGDSHIGTGGDQSLMANRPREGSRATREAMTNPTRYNIRRYLRVHIDDETLV